MKKIFITATNTDIGKTYTTCKLLEYYASQGHRVAVIKPIETGVESYGLDASVLLKQLKRFNAECSELSHDDIVPITFSLPAAPFIANDAKDIDLEPIFNAIKNLEKYCDILLIEGAGGLMVPIDSNLMMYELIAKLGVDSTLLVSHGALGCISDTLVNRAFLESKNIAYSWCLNVQNLESFKTISQAYFESTCKEFYIVDKDIDKIALDLI